MNIGDWVINKSGKSSAFQIVDKSQFMTYGYISGHKICDLRVATREEIAAISIPLRECNQNCSAYLIYN